MICDGLGVVIVDKDSTLADTRPRRDRCPTVNPDSTWDAYHAACATDAPIDGTARLVKMLYAAGYTIHILTWAPEAVRRIVVDWLDDPTVAVPYHRLTMRGTDDGHDSTTYKIQYAERLRDKGYHVALILEDWPTTAAALEAAGLPVLCVNPNYGETPEPA